MRLQLAILLASIKQYIIQLLAVIGAFFLPISGILFLIGFAIVIDTITGVWKSKTKILSLILVSIEVMSINENYKAVKGIDIWQGMKNLFARAKEIKSDLNGLRHNQDNTTPII